MVRKQDENVLCQICGKQKRASVSVLGELVRPAIVSIIQKSHPDWQPDGYICFTDLNRFRAEYVREILEQEKGELSAMDREVIESLKEHELLSSDLAKKYEDQLTFGERVADRVAEFGGSWSFIAIFIAIIVVWIAINATTLLLREPYDEYPFILLNLVLSCIAALQAPIIIMSQNRQAERDRMRSQEDYKLNLKAELEIRHLSDKIDHILTKQWERMMELMQIQMEQMDEIVQKTGKDKTEPPKNGV